MKMVAIPFDQQHEYQLSNLNSMLKIGLRLALVNAFSESGAIVNSKKQSISGSSITRALKDLVEGNASKDVDSVMPHVIRAGIDESMIHPNISLPKKKMKWIM
ncbi:hypothetical protein HDE_13275 [Halotydeus destructor]|nr:hypothetical protein HDE_13275 [Halotydeus destructor]